MSKTGTDGRREPPQTAVVILTALPLACAAFAYAWLGTPLPRWLAHLPWRKILQALPPLALGATCIPTLRLMRVAYHGLIHWRLTIGETFRAWLAGALGLILCGLLPLGTLDAFIHGQWITAITGMLMLVMIPICARIIRLYTEATDTVKSDWLRRLLFRRHQLLLERLERSKRGDMGPINEDEGTYQPHWSRWVDYGGLELPCPLDLYPEWFKENESDLEAYAAYHPVLLVNLKAARKRRSEA